jgi:hypothetical protein
LAERVRQRIVVFLSTRPEDQPWYPQWRKALEKVMVAQMARDSASPGTPEREAIDREYEAAIASFCSIANQVQ